MYLKWSITLQQQLAQMRAENDSLRAENAFLRRRLGEPFDQSMTLQTVSQGMVIGDTGAGVAASQMAAGERLSRSQSDVSGASTTIAEANRNNMKDGAAAADLPSVNPTPRTMEVPGAAAGRPAASAAAAAADTGTAADDSGAAALILLASPKASPATDNSRSMSPGVLAGGAAGWGEAPKQPPSNVWPWSASPLLGGRAERPPFAGLQSGSGTMPPPPPATGVAPSSAAMSPATQHASQEDFFADLLNSPSLLNSPRFASELMMGRGGGMGSYPPSPAIGALSPLSGRPYGLPPGGDVAAMAMARYQATNAAQPSGAAAATFSRRVGQTWSGVHRFNTSDM